jgi:ParB-like chromosome segregation protein Spo0J
MKFHPYAEIFPLFEDAEFDALVDDIKAHGLREKIWTHEGKILDGRNRFLACKTAKVEPQFREYRGDDALAFVVSLNVQRRHLTTSQRAMAAAEIANLSKGERKSNAHKCASQDEAAEALKVSRRSVQNAKKVVEHGSKELQKAVKSGEIPVTKAAAVVDLPKPAQLKAAKQPFAEDRASAAPTPVEVSPAPDFDFAGYEPEDDEAYKQNIENVMMADDKLAAMRDQLKQVHRELQAVKSSRDHYQSEAGAAVRLVKARDREIEKLKRQLAKLQERAAA